MSDKPRKKRKVDARLGGRIADFEKIEQDHEGAFTKPGSNKK